MPVTVCLPLFAHAGKELDEGVSVTGKQLRHLADELACVGTWLDAEAGRLRLVHCDGELASPLPRLPRFEPRRTQARDRPSRVPLSVEVV